MSSGEVGVLHSGNLNLGVMKTSKVTKLGQGWSPSQEVWGSTPQSTTMSISPMSKEPQTNTSMDSGVAGLRDTPVHAPGPLPVNSHTSPNGNANQNLNSITDNATGNNNNNNNKTSEENEVPEFIVDHSTRTTYIKGRFLGKVS